MPTKIAEAFAAIGAGHGEIKSVPWKTTPETNEGGVYVLSLSKDLDSFKGRADDASLADSVFEKWLEVCPKLLLDGGRPTAEELKVRIQKSWIPDEVILYIGKAKSLSGRLRGYYGTPIGACRPHSGGYFIKLLSNLDEVWVHYVRSDDPAIAENEMLCKFCKSVSRKSKKKLGDPDHPFPFANLEWPRSTRKRHGLAFARYR
jgi:hypothetical protein